MGGKEITAETIIGLFLLFGAILVILMNLAIIFMFLTIFLLVIAGLVAIFDHDDDFEYSKFIFLGAGVSFVLFFFCYAIGYGLGGTKLGQASIQTYQAFSGAEDQMQEAINQAIDTSCQTLDENSCNILKSSVKSFKAAQDVYDMADKLKTSLDVVEPFI